jgi:hypothetical protein
MTLKSEDLRDLVDRVVEIDSYKSKMGSDGEIVTMAFSTKTHEAAKDLVSFLEKGYAFVLDADATSGEQSDGTYKVFLELERNKNIADQILEVMDGVKKLTGNEDLKYRYYKNFKSKPFEKEFLETDIPKTADDYDLKINESYYENYKNFFDRSYLDNVEMIDDILTIKKIYADPLQFKFVDFGPTQETLDSINETFNANEFAEIIFLSKYIGDYNITKYGKKLTFENNGKTLVLERIIV